jgi:hypothetical protein
MSSLALRYLGSNPRLYTEVGSKRGDQILLENSGGGCGLYGPYVNLPRGQYYALVRFAPGSRVQGRGLIDVCTGMEAQVATSVPFDLKNLATSENEVGILFELNRAMSQCQVRLHCREHVSATIDCLEIEFRDVNAASLDSTLRDGIGDGAASPPLVQLNRFRQFKGFIRHPLAETRKRLQAAMIERLAPLVAERTAEILALEPNLRFIKQSGAASEPYQVRLPNPSVFGFQDGDYMSSANCLTRDFYHHDFAAFCQSIALSARLHRKLWEFAFIWHHLCAEGAIRSRARGLGFGVGKECLPSLFAKHDCQILATDAPSGIASAGWTETNQHTSSLDELFFPQIVTENAFRQNVQFAVCDMNDFDNSIRDFDFCWSSCSFEHLGSIENGLDFVVNSIEKSLKIGGVACHTSELNLSSNDETLDRGETVLFRRRDIEALARRLEARGHKVKRLPIQPGNSFIDMLVDLPPYNDDVSLRLKISKYVTTSFGIVVTRGR